MTASTLDASDVVTSYAVMWDAAQSPAYRPRRHASRTGPGLWGGFLNPPPPVVVRSQARLSDDRKGRGPPGLAPLSRISTRPSQATRGDDPVHRPATAALHPGRSSASSSSSSCWRALIPGDPVAALGERATEEVCDEFNARYGLDRRSCRASSRSTARSSSISRRCPQTLVENQFVVYLAQIVTGDLGDSIRSTGPSPTSSSSACPLTIELAFYALLFASVVGVTLGLISAMRRNSRGGRRHDVRGHPRGLDPHLRARPGPPVRLRGPPKGHRLRAAALGSHYHRARLHARSRRRGASRTSQGLPRAILDFLSGIYTLNFLITLQWEALVDAVRHLILPAIALGTISLAIIARITRSSLLEVLGLDYVRTARAKGVDERQRAAPARLPQRHAARRDDHRPAAGHCSWGAPC